MSYKNEIVQLHNEIVEKLNTACAPLEQANAVPTDTVQIAMGSFHNACIKAKLFVALDVNDFASAVELKAELAATGDILLDTIAVQKQEMGL